MTKWFAYIVLLLIFAPCLSSAKINKRVIIPLPVHGRYRFAAIWPPADTSIKKRPQDEDDKNKIKEISKAKRQSKPEKLDDADANKGKPKRPQRPEGMERPPEIPRRNSN